MEDITIGVGFDINSDNLLKQANEAVQKLTDEMEKNMKKSRGQLIPIDPNLHKQLQLQITDIEHFIYKYENMSQVIQNTLGRTVAEQRAEDEKRLEILQAQSAELLKQKASITGKLGANTRALNKAEDTGDATAMQKLIDKNLELRTILSDVKTQYKALEEEIAVVNARIQGDDYKAEPKTLKEAYEYTGVLSDRLDDLESSIAEVEGELTQLQSKSILSDEEKAKVESLTQDLKDMKNELEYTQGEFDKWSGPLLELQKMETTLKGAIASVNKVEQAIEEEGKTSKTASSNNSRYARSKDQVGESAEQASRRIYLMLRAVNMLKTTLDRANDGLRSIRSRIINLGKSMLKLVGHTGKVNKAVHKSGTSFGVALKNVLRYAFGIRSLFALFNILRRSVSESLEYIVQISPAVNKSISNITSSFGYMKNSLATSVIPLITAFEKQIVSLCNWIGMLATNIAKLIAALTGQSNIVVATKYWKDYAGAVGSANKQLQGFDELNNLTSGGGSGPSAADMFDTADIEPKWKELAEKIKAILKKIWEPIKAGFDKNKEWILKAWKNLTHNMRSLLRVIFDDFMTVWSQPNTFAVFDHLFHVLGNIIAIVSNLIAKFGEAWEKADTGRKIFEHLRDILLIIVGLIDRITTDMVNWTSKLDLSPMLMSVEKLLKAIKMALIPISGIIEDIWLMWLKPLLTWLIEDALPRVISLATRFIEEVDWESLREKLQPLWQALEKFSESVGEGLIIFLERCVDALADFVNGPQFESFIESLAKWLNSFDANKFAEDLWSIVEAIGSIVKEISNLLKIGVGLLTKLDIQPGTIITLAWNILKVSTALSGVFSVLSKIAGLGSSVLSVFNIISRIQASGGLASLFSGASTATGAATTGAQSMAAAAGASTEGLLPWEFAEMYTTVTASATEATTAIEGATAATSEFAGASSAAADAGAAFADAAAAGAGESSLLATVLTGDISANVAAGGTTAGATIGGAIVGGIAAAIGGYSFGNLLGQLFDKDLYEQYSGFSGAGQMFLDFFDSLGYVISECWTNNMLPFFTGIGDWFSEKGTMIADWWNTQIIPFFTGIGEKVSGFITGIADVFEPVTKRIGQFFEGLWIIIQAIWITVSDWFKTNVVDPIVQFFQDVWTKVSEFFIQLWEDIKSIWITVSTWFNDNVITPVINFFQNVWTKVSEFFTQLWEDIKAIWSTVAEWFNTSVIEPIKTAFSNFKTIIKNLFTTLWSNIKAVWSVVSNWFTTTIIIPVKTAFTIMANTVKTAFTNAWTAIKNGCKNAFNGIIGFIEGAINKIVDGINGLIGGFNKVATWASAVAGKNYGGIDLLHNVSIPRLAKGAVIPPNNEFLAVLGDQNKGTNIETPLSTMIEAFNAALAQNGGAGNEQMIAMMQTQIQLLQIIAEKEFGITDKQIFKSVRTSAKEFFNSTGREAFNY